MLKALALGGPVVALVLVVVLHRLEVWAQRSASPAGAGGRRRRELRRAGASRPSPTLRYPERRFVDE